MTWWVDGAVLALLALSGVLAMLRGFVREALGILGWIGAAAAAIMFYPLVTPWLSGFLTEPWLAASAAGFGIFIVTLVVLSLVSGWIGDKVSGSALGPIDRVLGLGFGVARGALLAVIAYIGAAWALPPAQCPAWLRDARVLDAGEPAAAWAFNLLPARMNMRAPRPLCREEVARRITAEQLMRPPGAR
jgi:membrane protein required for colicin V production